MKFFLLTGADGNLGGKLTKRIVDYSEYGVIAVSSFPERIPTMIEREAVENSQKIIQMSSEDMFSANLDSYDIKGVVHFAFSRAIFPNADIANSLDYSLRAFRKIVDSSIQNSIYISSQSVYGDTKDIRTVNTIPAPNSIYAMAKYAGEKLFEACYFNHDNLQHTILRLDNVIQSQNLVKSLCKRAKEGLSLELRGGKQVFSYIDISEVPDAVFSLLVTSNKWKNVYNVGPHLMRVSLMDVANTVKEIAKNHNIDIAVKLVEDNSELWAGMDTKDFSDDTGWQAKMSLADMVDRIFASV